MSYVDTKASVRKIKPSFVSIADHDRLKAIQLGLPVIMIRHTTPWGYTFDVKKQLCIPDIAALRLLYKTREYLKDCSLKEVSTWLVANTGHSISSEGLRLLLLNRFPFKEIMLDDNERHRIYKTPTDFSTYKPNKDNGTGETEITSRKEATQTRAG